MIKAVIFDYGGVVSPYERKISKAVTDQYGLKIEDVLGPFLNLITPLSMGKITETEFVSEFGRALNLSSFEDYWEELTNDYRRSFYLFPEVVKLIHELKQVKIKTAVLSNNIPVHAQIAREHNGYDDFDVTVLSCEVGLLKPDPKIYQITLDRLNVKPEECLYVDDLEENLVPARELGMKTLLAKNPKQVVADVYHLLNVNLGVGIVLLKDNSVLLQLRDNKPDISAPNTWKVPGGGAGKNENPIKAVKRECEEETGYKLHDPQFFYKHLTYWGDEISLDRYYWETYDGRQEIQCFEGQKMEFIPIDQLGDINLLEGQEEIIKKAVEVSEI